MKDDFLNFTEKAVPEDSITPISLVIPDVPSKVAYEIITLALATGEGISSEDIRKRVESRMNGSSISVTFEELRNGLSKSKYAGGLHEDLSRHEYVIDGKCVYGEDGACIYCGHKLEKSEKAGLGDAPIDEGRQEFPEPEVSADDEKAHIFSEPDVSSLDNSGLMSHNMTHTYLEREEDIHLQQEDPEFRVDRDDEKHL